MKETLEQRKTLNSFNGQPCVACGTTQGTCCEHVKTRGSGGPIIAEWNNMAICVFCHNEKGTKGISHMANRYPSYKKWLISHGWEYDKINKKWRYYEW